MARSFDVTDPALARSRPAIAREHCDFPQPEPPMMRDDFSRPMSAEKRPAH